MSHHPFRFGVSASRAASSADWINKARRIEGLGFSTLMMPDHFSDQLAPVPALAVAATATTTLRVGALVFANDYKHPVVLAKEVATLDVLSDGRVECGVGAGWKRSEYDEAGMPFDSAITRIKRLEEGLNVLKGLWGEASFSFEGDYYTVTNLDGRPKPVQQPNPPLLIGGGGRRLLSVAGRHADIVGFNPQARPDGTLDWNTTNAAAVTERIAWVREAAGDRFDQLELSLGVTIADTTEPESGAREIAERWGVGDEHVYDSPFALLGEPEQMAETLLERRDRLGISYVTVNERSMDALVPVVALLAGK